MSGEQPDHPFPTFVQRANIVPDEFLKAQVEARVARLCRRAVEVMEIDLEGMKILTEAATGPFAVTPVLAALAGSPQVIAATRDSRWGSASAAIEAGRALAEYCGVAGRIEFTTRAPAEVADDCDLVTNLGFVRPIDRSIIAKLSPVAAVSLMWEPWEFRAGEIDLEALNEREVALVATNEHHPEVATFRYLGPTAARLLFEAGIELVNAKLAVIASDPFGRHIADWLKTAGASVTRKVSDDSTALDAIIVAEHRDANPLFADVDEKAMAEIAGSGAPVIYLCGVLDRSRIARHGISVFPPVEAPQGVMTLTTAFAGPRPVIDLHAAGLKAGAEVVKARRRGKSIEEAVAIATQSGYGLPVKETHDAAG